MRTVSLTSNERGAAFSKFLICWQQSRGNLFRAAEIADERCRTTPTVQRTFEQLITRGAVGAQAISATDAYAPGTELLELLQSRSIYGRLEPKCRHLPPRTKTPVDLSPGTFAWKGEGLPATLTKDTSGTITTEPFTAAYTVVVSNELFRFGRNSEAFLRELVVAGLARGLDGQLLDRSVGLVAGLHPASLTNGTASLSSAGTTGANVAADLATLMENTTTPLDNAVLVLQTRTYLAAQAKLASVGYPVVPGYLAGLPVIAGSTSPRQLALLDCDDIAFWSDTQVSIDVTTEASVEMVDSSSQSGLSGTGAQLVSLFQSGLTAIRIELPVSYQHIHFNSGSPTVPAGAAVMAVSY